MLSSQLSNKLTIVQPAVAAFAGHNRIAPGCVNAAALAAAATQHRLPPPCPFAASTVSVISMMRMQRRSAAMLCRCAAPYKETVHASALQHTAQTKPRPAVNKVSCIDWESQLEQLKSAGNSSNEAACTTLRTLGDALQAEWLGRYGTLQQDATQGIASTFQCPTGAANCASSSAVTRHVTSVIARLLSTKKLDRCLEDGGTNQG